MRGPRPNDTRQHVPGDDVVECTAWIGLVGPVSAAVVKVPGSTFARLVRTVLSSSKNVVDVRRGPGSLTPIASVVGSAPDPRSGTNVFSDGGSEPGPGSLTPIASVVDSASDPRSSTSVFSDGGSAPGAGSVLAAPSAEPDVSVSAWSLGVGSAASLSVVSRDAVRTVGGEPGVWVLGAVSASVESVVMLTGADDDRGTVSAGVPGLT